MNIPFVGGIEDLIHSFSNAFNPPLPKPTDDASPKGYTSLGNGQYVKGTPGSGNTAWIGDPGQTPPPGYGGRPLDQFAASVTPQPTTGPLQQFNDSVTPQSDFKYRMGSTDYSDIAPQVQTAVKGTPLEPYANDFVQAGQKYKVDPRVLVTIANNESSLGKNYPTDTNNPFGYTVGGVGVQALRNAGFTSVPMAIDHLTARFSHAPTANYKQFYQEPTLTNLQAAYNANPSERSTYLKNAGAFVKQFK